MASDTASPPTSTPSTPSSLTLDLSALPPLIMPQPPSNTLLITNLNDPAIFHPTNLSTIRDLISTTAPLYSFSPLKSLRRIIATFPTTASAILVRQLLDNKLIFNCPTHIYFGAPISLEPADQHLHAPPASKQFFISPPPSPPHGWEMRDEAPPNKEVHADDLAEALAKLHARPSPRGDLEAREGGEMIGVGERRSGSSTVVYHPGDHGDDPLLPRVLVVDTTEGEGGDEGPKIMAHTARPPVELMEGV